MKSIIIGAGTYGEVYLHYLKKSNVEIVGFLDDDPGKKGVEINGVPVRGRIDDLENLAETGVRGVYCPIGSNALRVAVHCRARNLGFITPNFIHESAVVDSVLEDDCGIFLLAGAVVMPHVSIEKDVMISMGAKIAHHTKIGQGAFLSTNVSVGAGISLGRCSYIGMSATLVTGKCKSTGPNALVGAGAVVVSDVGEGEVFAGVPAKCIKRVNGIN